MLAHSADQQTHEWERWQGGIFTHELVSGLRGAADLNGDGAIEYSELGAFISAANSGVSDPHARLEVAVRPPRGDERAPLIAHDRVTEQRVLLFAGQTAEALSVMRALCMGRAGNPVCQPYAVHFADALASSASSLESAEPSLGALRGRYTRGSGDFEADTRAARIVAADCALRARLAATAEATREVCAQALAETVAVHGETHPDVAVVRTAFATALQAGRQRAEATAQREAAAPIIETLGPQHPLRARPRRGR